MIFEDKNIKSQKLVIDLEFVYNTTYDKVSNRKYYLLRYKDNSHKLFFTTNEPDNNNFKKEHSIIEHSCLCSVNETEELNIINEEYTEIENFKQLVSGFENSNFINYYLNKGFNTLPKYIYYNINFIDDEFKQMFLTHLKDNINHYVEGDLTQNEESNIYCWEEYLN